MNSNNKRVKVNLTKEIKDIKNIAKEVSIREKK